MLSSILSVVIFTQLDAKKIYKNLTPCIVVIKTDVGSGSGFVLRSNGLICTAAHVIENAKTVRVRFSDGKEYESTGLIDVDEKNDLAVLRAKFLKRQTVKIQTKTQAVGSKLFIVSAPLGLEFSISEGILSQYRTFESAQMLQHTCQTSPGSSGGAVCNQAGEVVGVHNSKRVGGEGLNFAVAAKHVANLNLTLPTIKWENIRWKSNKKRLEPSPLDKKAIYSKLFEAIWNPLSELYYVQESTDELWCELFVTPVNEILLPTSLLKLPEKCKTNGDYFRKASQTFEGDSSFPSLAGDLLEISNKSYQLGNSFDEFLSALRDAKDYGGFASKLLESFKVSSNKVRGNSIVNYKFARFLVSLVADVATEPSFEYRFVSKKVTKIEAFKQKTKCELLVSRFPTFKLGTVYPGSILEKSGVKDGDVILSISGKHPLDELDEFLEALDVPGNNIDIVVRTLNGLTKKLTIRTS